jgi:transcriptional regulator GlxA family with amidase domain
MKSSSDGLGRNADILDNLHTDVSLANIAAELRTDVYSMSRWFKTQFGKPPHRFVHQQRVARARRLLKLTERR